MEGYKFLNFECKKLQIVDTINNKKLVDISFNFSNSLAIVGESGSGKTLTLKSILGLLPSTLKIDLNYSFEHELIRGKSLSYIPQNPFTALSPLTKIKEQYFGDINFFKNLLSLLGVDENILNRYPSQLSGGQLQRVVIGMSLTEQTKLLLLDEPTTALDYDTKMAVIELILKLQEKFNFLILFVTHEINIVKNLCSDMLVLNRGKVVEIGKTEDILTNPKADYTKILINSTFENRKFRE